MDPYVLGDGVLVMTPFCSVLQCLCARPLASALMRFRSASARAPCRDLSAASLPASPACLPLPASPCARAISPGSVRPADFYRSPEQEGELQKGGKRSSARCLALMVCSCSCGCMHSTPRSSRATRATCAACVWQLTGSSTGPQVPQVPLRRLSPPATR